MLYSNAIDRIISGQRDLFDAQQGLVTGRKLNSPSDNPATFTRVSNYKNMQSALDQYQRNINNARSYLAAMEDLCGAPVHIVSTGPDRSENIILQYPFET